jgi:tetratricopeptide (TPR) repeat protein
VDRVNGGGTLGSHEIALTDQLLVRHGGDPGVRTLASAVYSRLARQEHAGRRVSEATAFARRAASLDDRPAGTWLLLAQLAVEAGRWADAEDAARAALAREADSAAAGKLLGYALVRLDRAPEAVEVLEAALRHGPDLDTQGLLHRVRQGLRSESGMAARQLAHFTVRYDGGEHEEVGREILAALDRHHATLARAFDHEPAAPVPVILFTRQAYYDASGAPAWSGGAYDLLDGRVRIPIGGLTRSLTPDMDRTLVHELTHAFVADLSRGTAPREVHEGLAQYMEGRRLQDDLDAPGLRALADGRTGGPRGYYLLALGHVEHLVAERGLGGLNDLLRAMARTGSVDAAFREVYGQAPGESLEAFRRRLRQQHGS